MELKKFLVSLSVVSSLFLGIPDYSHCVLLQLGLLPALENYRNLQDRLHRQQLPCLGDCAPLAAR